MNSMWDAEYDELEVRGDAMRFSLGVHQRRELGEEPLGMELAAEY